MDRVPYIDQSGLYALESVILGFIQDNIEVEIVGLQKQPQYMMERIDIIPDLIPRHNLFKSIEDYINTKDD